MTRRSSDGPRLLLVAVLAVSLPLPGAAQDVTDRSPNLSAGWVASPGSVHFNFNHRFWLVSTPQEEVIVN
jgi:hypothetical protein